MAQRRGSRPRTDQPPQRDCEADAHTGFSRRAAILVALLLASAAVAYVAFERRTEARTEPSPGSCRRGRLELVTASGVHVFDVEIAATPEKRALGLMFRTCCPRPRACFFRMKCRAK